MKYVLTLVHGTWPDVNGWVAPGSSLRRLLRSRLSFANVAFREFSWTGANTHQARIDAGVRLARFLCDGHAQYPDARHFVVAHSHGGNVALYAMREPAARQAVAGIVTLGTPFIHARRRDPHRHADAIAWLTLGVAALVPFIVFDGLSLPRFAAAWLMGMVVVMVKTQPTFCRWVTQAATREQAGIVAAVQPPAIDPSKLMIVCARGDEARRWLRTWDVVAQSPFVIGCTLFSIVTAATRVNLPILADGLLRSTLHRGLDEMEVFGFNGWALTGGVIVLGLIWAVVLMGSGIMRWPGYWREPLLANVLVAVGTNTIPAAVGDNAHTARAFDIPSPPVRFLQRRVGAGRTAGVLRHTAICDDSAVVAAIADWIGGGLRR